MTLRSAHGRARDLGAVVVVETAAPDELPAGVPAPARQEPVRDASGLLRPSPGTTAMAAAGGRAAAEAARFRRLLGLRDLDDAHPYSGYLRLAREHREEHSAAIAATVGGGQLSPGVSSIIASASLALAASRYMYDLGAERGDARLLAQAATMADRSRTALLTAHELAAREAAARPRQSRTAAVIASLTGGPDARDT